MCGKVPLKSGVLRDEICVQSLGYAVRIVKYFRAFYLDTKCVTMTTDGNTLYITSVPKKAQQVGSTE